MIPVAEARRRIVAAFRLLPAEQVGLEAALGRVLAEDIAARVTQPPAAVSAMDGYAVRADDVEETPAILAVVANIPAGQTHEGAIGPGEAARIFTGAPLPEGTDTIVIQEDTEAGPRPGTVLVREGAPRGRYVRPAGLDFHAGDTGLVAGRRLTARDIGLAAAMNVPWLSVVRRPRIAILSTGDELVMPGEAIGPGRIVSSNGLALAAFVRACGGDAVLLGIAPDDREALRRMASGAVGADLLVVSGGASVGDHDLVQDALGSNGLAVDFWKIAMRPGKPLMFGRLAGTPVLGFPGNPVSSLVCALIFLRPAIAAMLGATSADDDRLQARLGRDLEANDRREDHLRATLSRDGDGHLVATPFERQDSSMLSLLARADALILRPPLAPAARAGAMVEILTFPDLF